MAVLIVRRRLVPQLQLAVRRYMVLCLLGIGLSAALPRIAVAATAETTLDPAALAKNVTIYRDTFGTPHIDGRDDAATVFGFAYAQAEDFFWQIEDSYILSLGRYSEILGPKGLNSDLLNRAFEIVARSQQDYDALEPEIRRLCEAYVAGLNYYLAKHPEVKPRLIKVFEPWHVLAFGRHVELELCFRYTRLSSNFMPRTAPSISAAVGSNAWAIGPSRTKSGHAMLFANPHQPWYGFGQLFEAHLRSGEGWNFSGATFYGSPMPTIGHNEDIGWSFTVNEPDIADVWRETFDDPNEPLNYRYGDGYKRATQWKETVKVRQGSVLKDRVCTFTKTHHGPIVAKEGKTQLSAQIAKLYDANLLRQMSALVRAKNVDDFRRGMSGLNFPIMNAIYADRHGDIFYMYNGIIPRRDPQFDWSQPVDGSDPRTEWQGFHSIDELPQVLNPRSGFLQNCNSSPFTVTDEGNPSVHDFPHYMAEDRHDDKRRAKISRQILREMHEATFADLEEAAFDTTLYWAQIELPRYGRALEELKKSDPKLAERVAPYLEHLLAWNYRVTKTSTQAPLCVEWYEEMYGATYPGETLKEAYQGNTSLQLSALVQAASKLQTTYGSWKVAYGDIYRIQRHANVAELFDIPFDDALPSLPCVGSHGPMGVVFTQYYSPTVQIPFVRALKKHYGVVGLTYLGVFEFGEKVRGGTLVQFGASGDPNSPHFFDQAKLLSDCKVKPELFDWDDVKAACRKVYHPGEPTPETARK